jgi:hypothetical protein
LELATCRLQLSSVAAQSAPPTGNTQTVPRNLRLGTSRLELAACNLKLVAWNLQLGTCNLKLGTCDLHRSTSRSAGGDGQEPSRRARHPSSHRGGSLGSAPSHIPYLSNCSQTSTPCFSRTGIGPRGGIYK